MKPSLLICGCVITCLLTTPVGCVDALADPPEEQRTTVTIPLDQIWAYDMPGTRDIRDLEPTVFGEEANKLPAEERERRDRESLINQIVQRLNDKLPVEQPEAGFAVLGTGTQALREAHAVLVTSQKPRETFPCGSEVSLVFFSYSSNYYVRLEGVHLRGEAVVVRYQFVPHKTKEMTVHFALIPIDRLSSGKFCVELVKSPMKPEFVRAGFASITADEARRIICRSFSFSVVEKGE